MPDVDHGGRNFAGKENSRTEDEGAVEDLETVGLGVGVGDEEGAKGFTAVGSSEPDRRHGVDPLTAVTSPELCPNTPTERSKIEQREERKGSGGARGKEGKEQVGGVELVLLSLLLAWDDRGITLSA